MLRECRPSGIESWNTAHVRGACDFNRLASGGYASPGLPGREGYPNSPAGRGQGIGPVRRSRSGWPGARRSLLSGDMKTGIIPGGNISLRIACDSFPADGNLTAEHPAPAFMPRGCPSDGSFPQAQVLASSFSAVASDGALRSRCDMTETGSGHGMASSGSSKAIDTSSDGSCGRSMRYDTSAGSVSAWKPCAQPAGT